MKICNYCHSENKDFFTYCQKCGEKFTGDEEVATPQPPKEFPTEPDQVLSDLVLMFVTEGYQVISQTETTAQLFRKKKLSKGKTLAFGAIYLAARAFEKDQTAFVSVNPDGSYQVVDEAGDVRKFASGERYFFL